MRNMNVKRLMKNVVLGMVCVFFILSCSVLDSTNMSDDLLAKARMNMKNEKYGMAIAQLINHRNVVSDPDIKAECTYRLGECYFELKSYYDAKKEFEKYIADYPNTKWESESRSYLDKIKNLYVDKDGILNEQIADAQKKISELENDLKSNFQKADLHVELGNIFWSIGQYNKAGKEYLTAINVNPQLKKDPLIKERLIFDLDGNLIPVKGQERIQLEAEKNPVQFFNLYDSTLRDKQTGTRMMYMVTGQIKNQSLKPILDLTIEVTLYNVGGNVLDVTRVFVGKFFPGEIRSFSAISQPLDNVHNVVRYECKAFYDH